MLNYLKVKKGLYFINQVIKPEAQKEKLVEVNSHHIFVIDCSGSMSGELNTIRKDLFNKISTILKPSDSVTIIWFSGRNEYGALVEDYTVNSPMGLEKLRETINKYLTPQGLTAFKQPLEQVKTTINNIRKAKPNHLHSMFFLTDGCDNQWSTKEILNAVSDLKTELNAATIVEYGWYCNRQLMSSMAQELGGVHIVNQHFQDVEPYIAKQFLNDNKSKRKYVQLESSASNGVAFNVVDGDIVLYSPNENNEVLLGVEGETNIFYFTENEPTGKLLGDSSYLEKVYNSGEYKNDAIVQGLYVSCFANSRKSDYNMVSEALKLLGDVTLIKIKANTFGTQKITELEQKFADAANNSNERYTQGYNPNAEPAADAFCVMDLINELMSEDDNFFYPQHEAFSYKRIGAKAVVKTQGVSYEDKAKIEKLLAENKLSDLQEAIDEIKENQIPVLKFEHNNALQPCSIGDLVWNETRANLSVQVRYEGFVILPADKAKQYGLPEKFPTQIFRNYTIIKDGIIHTYNLPVSLSEKTFNKLQSEGMLTGETWETNKVFVLNFSEIPVINRKMVETLSAKDLFYNQYELTKLQALNYVYTSLKKKLFNNASEGFKDLYGEEATAWLATVGLKDYGFNPPSTLEKQGEEINVNVLEVKIDKLSSSVTKKDFESAEKKIAAGKEGDLTPKESLVAPAIKEFQAFQKTLTGTDQDKLIKDWLYQKSKTFRSHKNKLMTEISKAKFLTIVGKSWFKEFASRDEKEMTLNLDSRDIKFVVEDSIETIKI